MPKKPKTYWMSYSQSNNLKSNACLYKWKLRRIDGIKLFSPTIFTLFGTAIHETLQDWLKVVYNKSKKEAMKIDLFKNFKDKLLEVYKSEKENCGENFVTMDDIEEVIDDSKQILKDFKKKWFDYFGVQGYELKGIERVINTDVEDGVNNFKFFGKIDIVLYDINEDKYYIIDLKTSFAGWNKSKVKKSRNQLLYYKEYFSKQNDIPLDKIIPMFIILRRKIFGEDKMKFKVSHVSKKIPPSKRALKNSIKQFHENLKRVFKKEDGLVSIREDVEFKPNLTKDNCKWCPYKGTKYCDKGV